MELGAGSRGPAERPRRQWQKQQQIAISARTRERGHGDLHPGVAS